VFAGNRVDVTTVEEIVGTMEARYGSAQRIWVMDRGMTSEKNLAWLRQGGRHYLLGTSRGEIRKWSRELAEARDWHQVRAGIEAKLCTGPDGSETFLLCRSGERRAKEQAMHARFAAQIEQGLTKLAQRLAQARRRLDREAIGRQIGRLLARNSRAAGRYRIQVQEDRSVRAGVRLEWAVRSEWDEWARTSEGCYVLRTNVWS